MYIFECDWIYPGTIANPSPASTKFKIEYQSSSKALQFNSLESIFIPRQYFPENELSKRWSAHGGHLAITLGLAKNITDDEELLKIGMIICEALYFWC